VSSSLTAALQAYLAADATLTAAATGGVWIEPAPQGVTQPFVVIEPTGGFYEGCDIERSVFDVTAVAPAASVASVRTAANRLEVLLDDNADIRTSLTGFVVLGNWRTSPIDETLEEVTGRWVRVGGEFTLIAEPA
jgi:hypothetical protein